MDRERQRMLESASDINALAHRLARAPDVNRFDDGDDKECGTLAFCLSELEKSFIAFLDVHLPKLMPESLTPNQIDNVLIDIGLELCHILFQIKDPKYFEPIVARYEE